MADVTKIPEEYQPLVDAAVQSRLDRANKQHTEEVEKIKSEYEKTLGTLKSEHAEQIKRYKDFDAVSEKAGKVDEVTAELERVRTEKTGLDEKFQVMKTSVDDAWKAMFEAIPEDRRTLVPEKLETHERIRFALANSSHIFGQNSSPLKPTNPDGDKPPEKPQSGKYGGYESPVEFAKKNPHGYKKWRDEGGIIEG